MLLLTRAIGEGLKIGDNVTITVMGLKGNRIRIGIDAPRNIQVDREDAPVSAQNATRLPCRSAA